MRCARKIEAREPLSKAFDGVGTHPFGAADEGRHPAEVISGHVVVGYLAQRQLESEIGCAARCVGVGGEHLHPPGRTLQERNRAGEHRAAALKNRCANSHDQTEVVIKRQPQHNGVFRWCDACAALKEAAHRHVVVELNVFVGNHDAGRPPGRSGRVLQIRRALVIVFAGVESCWRIQIQQINFDDRRGGFAGLRRDVRGDLAYDSGRGENGGGRRVAQHRIDTLIGDAAHRDRQRDRDDSGLQRAQEGDDVVEALGRQYHRAIAG